MLWVFGFVVITAWIVISYIIFSFTGQVVFPPWLYEILFGYYWFSAVFRWVNQNVFDATKKRSDLAEYKPLLGWFIFAHIITAYTLSFLLVPLWLESWILRLIIAYPGSMILTVVLPVLFLEIYHPYRERRLECERLSAEKIAEIAQKDPLVQQFANKYAPVRVYVYDHQHKNRIARCVFLYRQSRREREGLFEDIVLDVPVDMQTRTVLTEQVALEHYLHHAGEEHSAVLPLAEQEPVTCLDEDTLEQLDYLPYRFPLLKEIPFRLATRQTAYEIV